jgi:3-oxoacyl-[acyl-carrier protein] reductase
MPTEPPPQTSTSGRVALVTGASRGIGRGIALRLARDGFDVVVNFASSVSKAQAVAEEIRAMGQQSWTLKADMADLVAARSAVAQAHQLGGRLDVLVNNAGIGIRKPFAEITPEAYDAQFAFARGAFFAMQEAAKLISPGGRIVNITSAAVRGCAADAAIYAGAKSAMEAFARCLSRSLGQRDITVNVVAPGATLTDLLAQAPEGVLQSVRRNAFNRAASVDEVADVVAMICGPDARWLTGQIIHADGGL